MDRWPRHQRQTKRWRVDDPPDARCCWPGRVVVLGGSLVAMAAAAIAAATGRAVLTGRSLRLPRRNGHGGRRPQFLRAAANVHRELRHMVHGVADELLQRIDALGGLNEPHSIFGRTLAQAYDERGLQVRDRRVAAGPWGAAAVPCAGLRRAHVRCRAHRRAAGRDALRPPRDPRTDLHRLPRATANCSPRPVRPGSKAMPRASCCTRR